MKPIKYFAAAAMALLAMGCSKEQTAEVADGQQVQVSFTAELPGGLATKAIGDGMTAKALTVAVYENDAEKTELGTLRQTKTLENLKTTVNFSLVKGKTYNFVFWAQAEEGAPYDITDLKQVKVSYEGAAANDEVRDAFYATRKELKVNGALTETVKLYRPFAQVNFGTADYEAAVAAGMVPVKSTFTATDAAKTFDTFAEEGLDATDVAFTEAELPGETLKAAESEYTWMAMNYIIPAGRQGEAHISNLTAEFFTETGESVKVSAPQAPVRNNYRTNVLGNLLTSQVIFNVEVVPAFEEPDYDIDIVNIKNAESLKALFATGGVAALQEDIETNYPLVLRNSTEVTLDLNGHSIVNKTQVNGNYTVVFNVTGNSHLTINGDGEVAAVEETSDVDGYRMAVWAYDDAVVDINGGYFHNSQLNANTSNLVFVMDNAVVNIAGGKFETAMLNAQGTSLLLNLNDADRATAKINVTGGEFVKFDPSHVNEGAVTSFLADGYQASKVGDSYMVGKAGETVVSTEDELAAAVEAAQENAVILIRGGEYKNVLDVRSNKSITFKPASAGEAVVVAGVNGQSNNTLTNCVFEDITFDNSIQETGWFVGTAKNIMPCIGVWGGQYTFKNCKFIVDGNSKKETGVMTWWTVKECETVLNFQGCTFEGKDNNSEARAMQIYGHVTLNVDGCALTTAKRYALKYAGNEGYVATIKNCNVSNCQYTVELGSDLYSGSKYVVNFENNTLAEGIADYKVAHEEDAIINGGTAK